MKIIEYTEEFIALFLPFGLMMAGGIFMTVKGRFFQLSGLGRSVSLFFEAFKTRKNERGRGNFAAACNSLAATVGTGNIAGVASALSIGGAGAVFWMWITAFMGMAIKFAEIKLAVLYRIKDKGEVAGGPMYYIKNGLPKSFSFLGTAFCVAAIPAVICSGNITQINAAVSCLCVPDLIKLALGVIAFISVFYIINRSKGAIGRVTERLVPIMALIYISLSLGVILKNIEVLPQAVKMIFVGAFSPRAVTGGAVGSVFTAAFSGASRGIFSNEAGLGTSAMAHADAVNADPETQGFFGIFEVFVDTVVLCSLTALTILCSGVKIEYGIAASSELVCDALATLFGGGASILLFIMMAVFAFSSVIGWAVYGNSCCFFLFGSKGRRVFNLIYPLACIAGAAFNVDMAWRSAAFFNGIMLCINLPAVVYLKGEVLEDKENEGKNRKNKGMVKKGAGRPYSRPE